MKPSTRTWFLSLILVIAVGVAYHPVWFAQFIYDDDLFLTANPCITGQFGLKEIWTTQFANICPLVTTTFWLEHLVWGFRPLGYHLVNLAFHAANGIVLWRVLRSLAIPNAWLGAALWTLHPLQVESVAWVTELKNCQSGFFYLLTILYFLEYLKFRRAGARTSARWRYAATLIFGFMAMASKTSVVILPLVLGLCEWWLEGEWTWRKIPKLIPFFVMAMAASALTVWVAHIQFEAAIDTSRGWSEKLVTAGDVFWFYLQKIVWPHPLIYGYPRWEFDMHQASTYLPFFLMVIAMAILWLCRNSWGRPYFFTFAYYAVALLPVMDFTEHVYLNISYVADHFAYVAAMGPLALAGAALDRFATTITRSTGWLKVTLAVGLLLALGLMCRQRAWVYQNQTTLWTDTLRQNPESWIAHNQLGLLKMAAGDIRGGMLEFQQDLEINPNDAPAYNILALECVRQGRLPEAMELYQNAEEIEPKTWVFHLNRSACLIKLGRKDEAIAEIRTGLSINPFCADAYPSLINLLLEKGHTADAIIECQKLLKLQPENFKLHNEVGVMLAQQGRVDEGLAELTEALRINPQFKPAQENYDSISARAKQPPKK